MSAFWAQFGLSRNPFFQEPLSAGGDGATLTRFFTGRAADLATATTRLSHDEQTRVVLLGAPGVGKTSLLNQLLATVQEPDGVRPAWLVPRLDPINLPRASTLQDFCIEILRHVLDMRRQVAARRPSRVATAKRAVKAAKAAALPSAALWERVERMVEGALTVSPQVLGVGITSEFTPPTAASGAWLPLTKEALVHLVAEAGCDVVIAVNNAENLADPAAERAGSVLADARDIFLTPHTHWILAGTPDFFDRSIQPHRQLAGVMGFPLTLPPLDAAAVEALIDRRYAELRIEGAPFTPPVAVADAGALANVFVGDLRELLRALEAAVLRLAPVRPSTVPLHAVMGSVGQEQVALYGDVLNTAAWEHLRSVVLADPANGVIQRFRETDAVRLLAPMRQPTVHGHKKRWIAEGFVREDGRTGAAEWFTVTGEALLAMYPGAVAQGVPPDAFLRGRNLEQKPLASPSARRAKPTGGRRTRS